MRYESKSIYSLSSPLPLSRIDVFIQAAIFQDAAVAYYSALSISWSSDMKVRTLFCTTILNPWLQHSVRSADIVVDRAATRSIWRRMENDRLLWSSWRGEV